MTGPAEDAPDDGYERPMGGPARIPGPRGAADDFDPLPEPVLSLTPQDPDPAGGA